MPPVYSAKKVDGHRAYDLARQARPVEVVPARVTLMESEILTWSGADEATLRLTCSTGFYVRTLAHEVGQLVGTGACLSALRRTRSGGFTIAAAAGMDILMAGNAPVVPMSALLPELTAVRVDADGVTRCSTGATCRGRNIGPLPVPRHHPARAARGPGCSVRPATSWPWPASTGVPGVLHPAVVLI